MFTYFYMIIYVVDTYWNRLDEAIDTYWNRLDGAEYVPALYIFLETWDKYNYIWISGFAL